MNTAACLSAKAPDGVIHGLLSTSLERAPCAVKFVGSCTVCFITSYYGFN